MVKFTLGTLLMTPGVSELVSQGLDILGLITRHANGDDGDLLPEDKQENLYSLEKGLRIFSAYNTNLGKVWVITESDRSCTTLLLPEEY